MNRTAFRRPALGLCLLISTLPVEAAPATPATPTIAWMSSSYTLSNGSATIPVKWDMWWGTNGNRWFLKQNDSAVFSGALTPNGQNAQSGQFSAMVTEPGTYRYVVSLCNVEGTVQSCSDSAPVSVTVSGTGGGGGGGGGSPTAPAAPTIAWLSDSQTLVNGKVDIPVKWNMWWGANGNSWSLKQNGSVVHTATLSANSPNAQGGDKTVSLTAAGAYSFVVSLCNKSGEQMACTDSAATTVNVTGSGGGGGGGTWDPWTQLDFSYWPHALKQGNLPYRNTTGKMVGAYFVEWGIYGRAFHAADIPAKNLTHLFYGFIPVCGPNESLREANPQGHSALVSQCQGKQNYEVVVHDRWAALDKGYPGDKWDQPLKGIFAELYRLKKTHPSIKILPSVGGWTLSDPLYDIGTQPEARAIFIRSITDLIKTYDFFDGIDIDWEFPGGGGANAALGSPQDGAGFAILMKELRVALDRLGAEKNRRYQLTAAVSGGVEKLARIDWENAHAAMDYINLMTYDYYGAWNSTLGHMTGLYDHPGSKLAGFNADDAVRHLLGRNVPAGKLTLGAAMYGRGWKTVSGGTADNPFLGTGGEGITGSWEKGIEDYKAIESKYLDGPNGTGKDGFVLKWDDTAKASYVWNPVSTSLISFDTPRSVKAKGDYVLAKQLGGIFAWEIDADNGQILNAMHQGLGHPQQ